MAVPHKLLFNPSPRMKGMNSLKVDYRGIIVYST